MQAYEAGLGHKDTRMVLRPDSDFFRYFSDPSGKSAKPAGPTPRRRQRPRRRGSGAQGAAPRGSAMTDFIVALGLVFVIEGLIFAASPSSAKNAMAHVLETADGPLRLVGIASAVIGVVLVWLVRG